jgi:hypothetical protein
MKRTEKIRIRLEAMGHTKVKVWWEPIGPALEMCGNSGGYMYQSEERGLDWLGLSFAEAERNLDRGLHELQQRGME